MTKTDVNFPACGTLVDILHNRSTNQSEKYACIFKNININRSRNQNNSDSTKVSLQGLKRFTKDEVKTVINEELTQIENLLTELESLQRSH